MGILGVRFFDFIRGRREEVLFFGLSGAAG